MKIADALPSIIDEFVDRMFDDLIIGFRFIGTDRERIKKHELEFARKHLLGEGTYTGRPIGPLHKQQRINRGQFARRLAILKVVLEEADIDPVVIEGWLEHDRRLERALTDGTDCVA